METSLAEDVKKPTRTLSPDSFFFMSPYRSLPLQAASVASQPAVGGDALNGEFQQQMAAAFAEARAADPQAGDGRSYPFDTCQPSELYIPSAGKRSRPESSVPPAMPRRWRRWRWWSVGRSRSRTRLAMVERAAALTATRKSTKWCYQGLSIYHPRPRRQRRADGATDRPEPRQL